MGMLTEKKRPDATSGRGKRMKMSARDAVGLIRRAKRRGAKVDGKLALAKPTGSVQKKAACSLCAMAGGSGPETAPAAYSCPLCSGKGGSGPALEAPRDSVQHEGAGTADGAEAQAEVLGAADRSVAARGGSRVVRAESVGRAQRGGAARRRGAGRHGAADAAAHARTVSVGALAMTEGSMVSPAFFCQRLGQAELTGGNFVSAARLARVYALDAGEAWLSPAMVKRAVRAEFFGAWP